MINYLAKFLLNLSDVSEPLWQFTRKEKDFSRSEIHDKEFENIKKLVSSPPLLKYYDPDKPLVLQCDTSEKGLGASLLQDGKPIASVSRVLTTTEMNYAQIKKEFLAIVFGVECFHQYKCRWTVTADSDHKPLEMIFGKPLASNPRHLQHYDIDIQYKREGVRDVPSWHTQQPLQSRWGTVNQTGIWRRDTGHAFHWRNQSNDSIWR